MITEQKLKEALKKDFKKLYVKEYSTTWEIARLIRTLEIDAMPLENTMKLFKKSGNGE